MPELSIVVLCYRANEQIISFFERLRQSAEKLTSDLEFVLVANYVEGSDDRTKEYVSGLASKDQRIRTVIKPKKGMMGWDMREGLKAATGNYICVIDGDGQFPIESIEKCYRIMKQKDIDLVKTYRVKRYDGWYRTLISTVYNVVFKIFFPGLGSRDANSKPKIISRKAYEKMNLCSNDWFIDAEIMINVRRYNMAFDEFPIFFYNIDDRSSFVKIGAILEFIRNLIAYRYKEFFIKRDE